MIKAYLLGILCFMLFLCVHAAVFHTFELKERFRAIKTIFFSLIPVYAALYLILPSGYVIVETGVPAFFPAAPLRTIVAATRAMYFLSGFMLYLFLFLGYCQFYFIVDRSISVRVMIEIENSPERSLSAEEIQRVYPFKGILDRRLEHMVYGNYIKERDGRYLNTGKGRAQARVFGFLKDFLRLGKGG
ncbi:MAG: hypothetical protein HZB22_08670 [Deltaproteobacteria bacterium]|nr:hypothetical protein [Deltaproteobacteria bacterium]